jgi:hypothetical protein
MKLARACWWGLALPLAIVSLSGLASAQSNPDRWLPMSPSAIVSSIKRNEGNLKWLWKMLRVEPKVPIEGTQEEGWEPPWDEECRFHTCQAEVISTERFLDEPGNDWTLRICIGEMFCRILLIHESNQGRRLVDYLDSVPLKWTNKVSVVASADKRWLVSKTYGGSGTGVATFSAQWFELRGEKLTEVLWIHAEGHDVNNDPGRKHSTRFLRYRRDQHAECMEFVLKVRWQTRIGDQLLWEEERSVTYRREAGQVEYKFDPKLSEATDEYIALVTAFDKFDLDAFLRLHEDRLLRIAATGPDWQKAWLKTLLKEAAAGPTKSALLKALGQPSAPR